MATKDEDFSILVITELLLYDYFLGTGSSEFFAKVKMHHLTQAFILFTPYMNFSLFLTLTCKVLFSYNGF